MLIYYINYNNNRQAKNNDNAVEIDHLHSPNYKRTTQVIYKQNVLYYNCGGKGHIARNCTSRIFN